MVFGNDPVPSESHSARAKRNVVVKCRHFAAVVVLPRRDDEERGKKIKN